MAINPDSNDGLPVGGDDERLDVQTTIDAILADGDELVDHILDEAEEERRHNIAMAMLGRLTLTGHIDDSAANTIVRYLIWDMTADEKIDYRLWEIAALIETISSIEVYSGSDSEKASLLHDHLQGLYANKSIPPELADQLATMSQAMTDIPGIDFSNPDEVFKQIERARQEESFLQLSQSIRQNYLSLVTQALTESFGLHDNTESIAKKLLLHAPYALELSRADPSHPRRNELEGFVSALLKSDARMIVEIGFSEATAQAFVASVIKKIVEGETDK